MQNRPLVVLVNVPCEAATPRANVVALGILCLAASLERAGFAVEFFDFDRQRYEANQFLDFIQRAQPVLLGLSLQTASFKTAVDWIRAWKDAGLAVPIVLGGHHPTGDPLGSLRISGADYVFRGEGELGLLQLARILSQGNVPGPGAVPGLMDKSAGPDTSCRMQTIEDLDTLPFPKRDFPGVGVCDTITVVGSRGCPHGCRYCINSDPERRAHYRKRSVGSIAAEVHEAVAVHGLRRVFLLDDCFSFDRNWAMSVAEALGAAGVPWAAQCRMDEVDVPLLEHFATHGCRELMFGIETMNSEAARANRKESPAGAILPILEACTQQGIQTRCNFMLGFPEDEERALLRTVRFAAHLPADRVEAMFVVPYPGTRLHAELLDAGHTFDWQSFSVSNPFPLSASAGPRCLLGAYQYLKTVRYLGQVRRRRTAEPELAREWRAFWWRHACGFSKLGRLDFLKWQLRAFRDTFVTRRGESDA